MPRESFVEGISSVPGFGIVLVILSSIEMCPMGNGSWRGWCGINLQFYNKRIVNHRIRFVSFRYVNNFLSKQCHKHND